MMFRFILFILSFSLCIVSQAQMVEYHEGLTTYSETKDGKTQYGFKNKSGKIVIPARFDGVANPFNSGQAIIILNNLYGSIDTKGKIRISAIYKKILEPSFGLIPIQNTTGLWGFYTIDLKLTIPCLYNNFKFTNKGKHIFVQKSGKWGMINQNNITSVAFEFKHIESVSAKQIKGTRFNTWSLGNNSGISNYQYAYDSVQFTSVDSILSFQLNGWEGLLSKTGSILLPNIYEDIQDVYAHTVAIKKEGQWGVKRIEDATWLIEPTYDIIHIDSICIHAGLKIGMGKSMHWKLYNHSGTLLYPNVFIDYHPFLNGLIAVQATSNLWGFIDEKGTLIIPFQYSKVGDFKNGLCEVEKNGQQLVINKSNNIIFNQQDVYLFSIGLLKLNAFQKKTYTYNIDSNTEIIPINADFIKIKRSGKYGLINTKGETILPTIYSDIHVGSSLTTFAITKDRITKIIQVHKGTYSIDRRITSVDGFYNDFSVMKYSNGRYGCIDNLGKIRVAPQYEVIRPFENDVAVVELNGKWGIINKYESFVAQPYYDSISAFRNKVCIVSEKGIHYLMDASGKILTTDGYVSITLTKGGNYLLSKNGFKGMANAFGNEIISPRYQKITELSPSLFHVIENNLHGVIDANRTIILHIKYHEFFYNNKTGAFLTAENGEADFITVK
jgi:hypothetical protein